MGASAGATLRERWAAIAPELAGHVAAIGFDADSGQLTVCPKSTARATKTHLEQTRIIAAANESAGRRLGSLRPGRLGETACVGLFGLGGTAAPGPRKRDRWSTRARWRC